MPLKKYGVLKGRPINRRLGAGSSPHYQMHIVDDDDDYRIAVNVKSKQSPSELLYYIDEAFVHPILDDLEELAFGFTVVDRQPGGAALDYIRGNLFNPQKMVPLPFDMPGLDNDLNEKIDFHVQRAMGDENAVVYAFGERWGPEATNRDKYFGFKPGNGIHDIHMNQGNNKQFAGDDGVWQDGGLLLNFPEQNQWVAVFLAFQSQAWHTDDRTGHRIAEVPVPIPIPEEPDIVLDGLVRIVAAKVNPFGHDPGLESVILINTTPEAIDLEGWSIADKNKKKETLKGTALGPGETATLILSGDGAQLSNKGGIITLLDPNGIKVDGVSYTGVQAKKQGWTLVF